VIAARYVGAIALTGGEGISEDDKMLVDCLECISCVKVFLLFVLLR
jgi:hypothetical protein